MSFIARALGIGNTPDRPAPIAAPSRADPAVEDARRREIVAAGKLKGAGANYLTSGTDLGEAPAARKYLTGQ